MSDKARPTPTADPLDRVLYGDDVVTIGLFDCPRSHPRFHDSGPASGDLLVFPRQAVEIEHPSREPIIAEPRVVTLYNHSQRYRRRPLSDYGDQSLWLRFDRAAVIDSMIDVGATHPALERSPFQWTHRRCDSSTYLEARALLRQLRQGPAADALAIQERAFALLRATLSGHSPPSRDVTARRPETRRRQRRLAARCKALLAQRFREPLTLSDIASELATTPFHLSRVFSQFEGQTLHACLMDLRLRAAVDSMIDAPDVRLTDIAIDHGFATPSHFSHRFRKHFGNTPAAFRRSA